MHGGARRDAHPRQGALPRAVARRLPLSSKDGALTDAKAAVEAEPQSADVRTELAAVREALAAQKEEEKELARKMLGAGAEGIPSPQCDLDSERSRELHNVSRVCLDNNLRTQ